MMKYIERISLSDVGSLAAGEKAMIKEWLLDNFCTENTLECELHELPSGGLKFEDTEGNLAAEDSDFGVHVLDGGEDSPGLLVVLFENLPQGIVIDRSSLKIVAEVIEGDIKSVADGYEEMMEEVVAVVPGLYGMMMATKKQTTKDEVFTPPPGAPADLAAWRARYPEPAAQRTIDEIIAGLERARKQGEQSVLHGEYEEDLGVPLKAQPTDPYEWLCQAKSLYLTNVIPFDNIVLEDLRPLEPFTQLKLLKLSVSFETDLSTLAVFEGLTELYVGGGDRSDWSWLSRLTKLKVLKVATTEDGPEDVELAPRFNLSSNTKLKRFEWYGNFDEIAHLELGPQVEHIVFLGKLSDISSLASATGLRYLDLRSCYVRDISPLFQLKNLGQLDISRNQVASLEGIEQIEKLGTLDADYNLISDFEPYRKVMKEDDEEDVEEWIEKTSRTQLKLTTPEARAVYDDWLNLEKWRTLADVLDAAGDHMGRQIRLRLANDRDCDLPWFWARGTMTRDPNWK